MKQIYTLKLTTNQLRLIGNAFLSIPDSRIDAPDSEYEAYRRGAIKRCTMTSIVEMKDLHKQFSQLHEEAGIE